MRLIALTSIVIIGKAWLIKIAGIELHYDEAQYWEWSRRLDWGYYSKGPLIAWLIAFSESLFGHGEWQVRLFAWLSHGIFLALIFLFAMDLSGDRKVAWWAWIITLATPDYFILGMVMTTDVLLFAFWTWGLWAAFRALYRNHPWAWVEFGLAVGLGALTKLSIGLLALVVGLYVLINGRHHRHLRSPSPWIGLLLLILCMSPMLIWNANHDWVMFRHELGHLGHREWSFVRPLLFLAGQWVALSPFVIIFALPVIFKMPATEERRFLWLTGLAWSGFFIFKAIHAKVQPNWPAAVYIGLLLLFAEYVRHSGARKKTLVRGGMLATVLLLALCFFPAAIGLRVDQDPFKDTKYWRDPIARIYREAGPVDFILTNSYQHAGELAFYWPHEIPVYLTGRSDRRFNQHDLWPGIERETGKNGLYVSTAPTPPPLLPSAFAKCKPLPNVTSQNPEGNVLRTFYIHKCERYRPVAWPKPSYY